MEPDSQAKINTSHGANVALQVLTFPEPESSIAGTVKLIKPESTDNQAGEPVRNDAADTDWHAMTGAYQIDATNIKSEHEADFDQTSDTDNVPHDSEQERGDCNAETGNERQGMETESDQFTDRLEETDVGTDPQQEAGAPLLSIEHVTPRLSSPATVRTTTKGSGPDTSDSGSAEQLAGGSGDSTEEPAESSVQRNDDGGSLKSDRRAGQKQMSETGACHFNIGSLEVFNRWWNIGSSRGLSTDTEIASFLIALYENTESAVQSAARCVHCHNPLTLVCTKCQHSPKQPGARKPLNNKAFTDSDSDIDLPENKSFTDADTPVTNPKGFATSSVQADTWDSLLAATFSGSKKRKALATRKYTPVKTGIIGRKPLRIKLNITKGITPKKVKIGSSATTKSENSDTDDYNADKEVAENESSGEGEATPEKSDPDFTPDKKFACDVCKAVFGRMNHLKRHKLIHTGERPYVCSECGQAFTRSTHLQRHKLIHKRLKLDGDASTARGEGGAQDCSDEKEKDGKKKADGDAENSEVRTADSEPNSQSGLGSESAVLTSGGTSGKTFSCNVCNASFRRSNHLKRHERIHTGEKPYVCVECGHAFSRSTHLKRHELIHTRPKPMRPEKSYSEPRPRRPKLKPLGKTFVCEECGSAFSSSTDLKIHFRIHTGEKPFLCKDCGAAFITSGNMRRHERTHQGDRPHLCSDCCATFTRAGDLRRHMKCHAGEKSYFCKECGAGFATFSFLRMHKRTHSEDMPYVCGLCNAAFCTAGSLKRHSQSHYADMPYGVLTPAIEALQNL